MSNSKKLVQLGDKYLQRRWEYIFLDGKRSMYRISDHGEIWSDYVNRPMNPAPNSDGYMTTVLVHDGKKYTVGIHRLVALAFIPNPDGLPEVNHKDGNKRRNEVENLEWVTHQENMIHANDTKLRSHIIGTENPNNKYSESVIRAACELLSQWWRPVDVAKELGIPDDVVKTIIAGKNWLTISSEYSLPENLHVNVVNETSDGTVTTKELLEEVGLPAKFPGGIEVRLEFRTIQKYKVQRSSHGWYYECKPSKGVGPEANAGG